MSKLTEGSLSNLLKKKEIGDLGFGMVIWIKQLSIGAWTRSKRQQGVRAKFLFSTGWQCV